LRQSDLPLSYQLADRQTKSRILLGNEPPEHSRSDRSIVFGSTRTLQRASSAIGTNQAGHRSGILILTRYIFSLALKWKVPGVRENPAKEVDLLKVDNKRERFLNEDEVRRLYDAVLTSDNPMPKYIVPMLLLTGARKREVLDARWEDFDVDNRLWRIPFTKTGKPRTVPMSDGVMSVLDTVPRVAGSVYVFPNPETGKPYVTIHNAWDTVRKRAGLQEVRMHDLRHSFASILINSGRSLYEVQHLLGHTQVKTTERYAHLQQDTLMKAANVVAHLVGTAAPQQPLAGLIGA